MKIGRNANKLKNKKSILISDAYRNIWVAMIRIRKRDECEELCKKRIDLEKTLGTRETDYEKCLKICRAFASS
jgi:hypothetical protein